jgi:hypothetical protein
LKIKILMLLMLVGLNHPSIFGHNHLAAGITEVPFTLEKGYVIVQAKIKKQVPVELILATGADYSSFNTLILAKYQLQLSFTNDDPRYCDIADCTFSYSTISDVTVGELKPFTLNMRMDEWNQERKRLGRDIFGRLGADFFKGRLVQFDFTKKVVRFFEDVPDNQSQALSSKGTTERIVLPMSFYRDNVRLPVVENVTIDGKAIRTVFDTGAATVVSLSPKAAKQLGKTPPPDKAPARADKVTSLKIADYELNDVPVSLYGKSTSFDRDLREFGAIAGTGLLQNFLVTFDYRSKLIIFEHL